MKYYKVGDVVRIKDNLTEKDTGIDWECLELFTGMFTRIVAVGYGNYNLEIDYGYYTWLDKWFTVVDNDNKLIFKGDNYAD